MISFNMPLACFSFHCECPHFGSSLRIFLAIEKYITYYNEKRIKEKLGWMSPVEYRLSLLAA
ncbi:IS3 family transposase [Lacrimispora sp. 38-1]|uniref:IS3 family transposase n=1 Tax=Lacrimispora sp. 38-1 TaxID=3125778 RepID=UPI003CF92413